MGSAAANSLPDGARLVTLPEGIDLASGKRLTSVDVAYETFGTLDEDGGNAVLICHALSGDSHVTSGESTRPGWWEPMVGPGKAIDTDRLFVICSNVLGGCSGTTGPASIEPGTDRPFGMRFPLVTVEDMVDVQAVMLEEIGIPRLACVVGGSMGGMQALSWAQRYPRHPGGPGLPRR